MDPQPASSSQVGGSPAPEIYIGDDPRGSAEVDNSGEDFTSSVRCMTARCAANGGYVWYKKSRAWRASR